MSNPQYGNSIRVGSLRIGGWLPVRSFVIGLGTVVATMMIILLGYLIPGLVFLLGMFLGLAIFGIPFGDADLTLAARIFQDAPLKSYWGSPGTCIPSTQSTALMVQAHRFSCCTIRA